MPTTDLDLLEIAKSEFRDAVRWYRSESPSVARRFALEVKAAIASIGSHPRRHPRWDDRYRFLLLNKFPYYVAYRIEPRAIVVVAVFHTSRDASAWIDR
jgi:plasmid stabilization system protein ParE